MIGLPGKGPGDLFAQSRAEPRASGPAERFSHARAEPRAGGPAGRFNHERAQPADAPVERLSHERAEPRESSLAGGFSHERAELREGAMRPARHDAHGGTRARLGVAALFALSACQTPASSTPELIELSNIRPSNIVPKSSPAQLVSAFRRICLANSRAAAEQALRKSGYIEKPRRGGTGAASYVVDNRNPAVMLSGDAERFSCVVLAEARTGQTARIEDFVAARFPKAVETDPRRVGARTERAWLAAGNAGGIVYTRRAGPRITPQYLMFGILRPGQAQPPGAGRAGHQ